MSQYDKLPCPVCNEEFNEDSDIVVCPICGTPHHRECYAKNNVCVNIDWHSENKVYDAELERASYEGEKKRAERENEKQSASPEKENIACRRCGGINPSNAIFCNRCGCPLSSGFEENAQNTQGRFYGAVGVNPFAQSNLEEKLDGVEGWKLSAVAKENQFKFLWHFNNFAKKKKKIGFNFAAFVFTPYYFLYRKMYGWGILGMVISLILAIPSFAYMMTNEYMSEIMGTTVTTGLDLNVAQLNVLIMAVFTSSILQTVFKVLSGLFANWLYFKKCKKVANKIDEQAQTKEDFLVVAEKKGGVNRALIIAFMVIYMLAVWLGTFFVMR